MKKMKTLRALWATLFGLLATLQCKAQIFEQVCPNPDFKETELDCPWSGVSRALSKEKDPIEIRIAFEKQIPGFIEQLDWDARSRGLLNLWGLSRNMDESSLSVKTVPPSLLAFFNSILKVDYDPTFSIGHAGLNHTYGYLFSNVLTPFGYKRARYVQGEIETGFNLPAKTFGGVPPLGTLLGNLTYFTGQIAFRDDRAVSSLATLREIVANKEVILSEALAQFDFSALKPRRLVERVSNESWVLELRTDIVPFTQAQTRGQALGTNEALLIYTLDFRAPNQEPAPKLITAFPVAKSFGDALFAQEGVAKEPTSAKPVPLKLKYNAQLPVTITADQMIGTRIEIIE